MMIRLQLDAYWDQRLKMSPEYDQMTKINLAFAQHGAAGVVLNTSKLLNWFGACNFNYLDGLICQLPIYSDYGFPIGNKVYT